MDLFYLFAFITFLHAVYNYAGSFSPSCPWLGVSRLCVQTTENADGRNMRPPTGIPLHFLDHWAVSGRQNLTSRSPIKARLALLHSSSQLSTRGFSLGFLVRLAPLRKYSCSLTFVLTGS